jgi:hypothetical protein
VETGRRPLSGRGVGLPRGEKSGRAVVPSLATSIHLGEGASRRCSSAERAKLGSKRPWSSGSGGGPLSVVGGKEVADDETKIEGSGATVGVRRRRTAIAKKLRRSTAPTKEGAEKRKRISSPPSSSSSSRSGAPDLKRKRYTFQIHCAFYDSSNSNATTRPDLGFKVEPTYIRWLYDSLSTRFSLDNCCSQ